MLNLCLLGVAYHSRQIIFNVYIVIYILEIDFSLFLLAIFSSFLSSADLISVPSDFKITNKIQCNLELVISALSAPVFSPVK